MKHTAVANLFAANFAVGVAALTVQANKNRRLTSISADSSGVVPVRERQSAARIWRRWGRTGVS